MLDRGLLYKLVQAMTCQQEEQVEGTTEHVNGERMVISVFGVAEIDRPLGRGGGGGRKRGTHMEY